MAENTPEKEKVAHQEMKSVCAASPVPMEPGPGLHPPEEKPANHLHRNLWIFSSLLLLLGLVWLLLWIFYLQYYESTDDAYANGNLVNINSVIPGSVIAFYADDTDLVVQGQLLILLDDTEYQIIYEKELAALAETVLQVKQLYDTVHVNRAIVENKKITFGKTQYDYENRRSLVDSQAISNQEFIHSRDDLNVATAELQQAEYQLKVAEDAAGNTSPENHPRILNQKSVVREAYYNLQHTAILSPTTGHVAQRTVQIGQRVNPTTDLMAVIPVDYVWVDANFKETQLKYMRIGQPATVTFDLYGSGVKYNGKVLGIASGSGSVFSLIPPQNATGNWIKIVQRLPVRISLDPETVKKYPTRLGISANVDVDITDQSLPRMAETPSTKPVRATDVFRLDLEPVDQLMDRIVKENLN